MLSLVLVLVAIAVIGVAVICAIMAVKEAIKVGDVPTRIFVACFGLIVGGAVVGGMHFTRVRPWVVRRLTGREVPRVPAPLALATRPGGESSGDGD